ncbi:hypothetical protein K438DRAFT_553870 [Mycena galopus ATCC 62051]|nr:hypothetical protein K438DRAFT_553870 [Mycena galopus ATCC 62051]
MAPRSSCLTLRARLAPPRLHKRQQGEEGARIARRPACRWLGLDFELDLKRKGKGKAQVCKCTASSSSTQSSSLHPLSSASGSSATSSSSGSSGLSRAGSWLSFGSRSSRSSTGTSIASSWTSASTILSSSPSAVDSPIKSLSNADSPVKSRLSGMGMTTWLPARAARRRPRACRLYPQYKQTQTYHRVGVKPASSAMHRASPPRRTRCSSRRCVSCYTAHSGATRRVRRCTRPRQAPPVHTHPYAPRGARAQSAGGVCEGRGRGVWGRCAGGGVG